MKILVCTQKIPYPLTSGDNICIYNIFKKLSKNHRVYLLYNDPSQNNQEYLAVIEKSGIFEDCIPLNLPDSSLRDRAIGLMFLNSKLVSKIGYFKFKEDVKNKVSEIVKKNKIEVIHSHDLFVSILLSDFNTIPKVLDLTDSHALYYKRELQQLQNPIDVFTNCCRFIAMRRGEKQLLKKFKVTTVVSPIDQKYLKKLNNDANIMVFPIGVDVDYYSPIKSVKADYPSILFSGTMGFPPNITAVFYIYKKILPLLRSQISNLKFYIVGRDPPRNIKNLVDNDHIIVTGFVDDIRHYILKASVVLAPMKSGSGIKIKILEAMAMGKPVVTNPMGAEALSEEAKNCLLIGETADEIANHVITLLRNKEKRVDVGKKGREIVMKEYTWDRIAEKYEKVYREAIEGSKYYRQES
jgi:glycosyltransferase involved in cell wall biosynthesis